MLGPPLFMAVAVGEGAVRPGYSAMRNFVSQLATSEYGWQQVANFLVLGVLVLAFVAGLHRARPVGVSLWVGGALAVFAAALLVAGIFPTDPGLGYPPGVPPQPPDSPTAHGAVHAVAGLFAFLSLAVAAFAAAVGFARARSTRWSAYSALSAVLMLGFCITSFNGGELTGLYQRIAIFAGWTWLSLFALRCRQRLDEAGPDAPAPPVRRRSPHRSSRAWPDPDEPASPAAPGSRGTEWPAR